VVGCRFGYLSGEKKAHVFPEPWGEAIDCRVVGTELDCIEEGSNPGISLSVLDGAKGFAKREFSEYYSHVRD
jgi:hypothetical protein